MLPDTENMGKAVIISLLPCAQVEIYVFEVLRPPSWFSTSGFLPFGRTTMPLCLLESWIPKTWVAVGSLLLFVYMLRYTSLKF